MSIIFNLSLIPLSESQENYYKLYNKLCKGFNIDVFSIEDKLLLLSKLSSYKNNGTTNDTLNIYDRLKTDTISSIDTNIIDDKIDVLLACHDITMTDTPTHKRQIKIFKYNSGSYDIPSIETFEKFRIKTLEYVDFKTEMNYNYNDWDLIPFNSKDYIDLIHCPVYGSMTDIRNIILRSSYNILRLNGIINMPISLTDTSQIIIDIYTALDSHSLRNKFRIVEYNYTENTLVFNTRIDQWTKSIRFQKIA